MNDGSLMMFAELPALLRHDGSSLKTLEEYLPLTKGTLWEEYVRAWPDTVSADGNGLLYERATSEQPIEENAGFVLLPTPQASDHRFSGKNYDWKKRIENHAASTASVLMNLRLQDGQES